MTRSSGTPERHRARRVLVSLAAVAAIVAIGAVTTAALRDGGGSAPVGGSQPAGGADPGGLAAGSRAPDFDLAALRGPGRVRLADFRGKPLVVNFWASWCIPCREEFPQLAAAFERYRDQGLEIVGITYRDIPSDSRAFARRQRATWTFAEGGDGDPVARAYAVRAIPQTFFVDRDGTITARFFGKAGDERLDREIRKILRRRGG